MSALWVVVGPVDHAAFFVPDVLTFEVNSVACFKAVEARSEVDVVCYQQCLTRSKLNDEPLVTRSFHVVIE